MKCNQCGDEFFGPTPDITEKMFSDHIKVKHIGHRRQEFDIPPSVIEKVEHPTPSPPPVPASIPPPSQVWSEPLLKYKYEGTCELNHQIKTIEVRHEEFNTVVAYCMTCDKEIAQQKVQPIYPYEKNKRK